MTKRMKDWTKINCKNCAFRGKNYWCGRREETCNNIAKDHLKHQLKDCEMGEYEEVEPYRGKRYEL